MEMSVRAGSQQVYEALKKLFITDKDGHITVDSAVVTATDLDIRNLTNTDVVTAEVSKWGGTTLTGRDISTDLSKLNVNLSTLGRLQPWWQSSFGESGNTYSAGAVAPHAETTRIYFTVTTGKLAMITTAHVSIMRDGAPVAAGLAYAYLDQIGVPYGPCIFTMEVNSAVGTQVMDRFIGQIILSGGDGVIIKTSDASTGGTYRYSCAVYLEEFDS